MTALNRIALTALGVMTLVVFISFVLASVEYKDLSLIGCGALCWFPYFMAFFAWRE